MFPKVQGTRTEETHMTLYMSFLSSLLFALGSIEFGAHAMQGVSPATLTCGLVGMFYEDIRTCNQHMKADPDESNEH